MEHTAFEKNFKKSSKNVSLTKATNCYSENPMLKLCGRNDELKQIHGTYFQYSFPIHL
jgi:hypothetical protein